MSNVIWKWNKTDLTQFDMNFPNYILNGSRGPFTGSVTMDVDELFGEPCLRISGSMNCYKGVVWRVSNLILPNRYQVEYEVLTRSTTYADGPNSNRFNPGVVLFGTFDWYGDNEQNYFVAGGYYTCFARGTASVGTNAVSITYPSTYVKSIVNYRPTAAAPSGNFSVQIVPLNGVAQSGYNQHPDASYSHFNNSNLKSLWQGSEMQYFGVGVCADAYTYTTTGAVWIANLRILKHPLDLEFDNF